MRADFAAEEHRTTPSLAVKPALPLTRRLDLLSSQCRATCVRQRDSQTKETQTVVVTSIGHKEHNVLLVRGKQVPL